MPALTIKRFARGDKEEEGEGEQKIILFLAQV